MRNAVYAVIEKFEHLREDEICIIRLLRHRNVPQRKPRKKR